MVVKIYISGISGNKEVKKRQQRVLLILDSRNIKYELVDIAEPDNEDKKDFMQTSSKSPGATISDPNPRHPLPPQIYNDDVYCGDYDQFDMANEIDEMEIFLKLAPDDSTETSNAEIKLGNGDIHPEDSTNETKETEEQESKDETVPDNNETKNEADVDAKAENGEESLKKKEEEDEEEEEEDGEEEAEDE